MYFAVALVVISLSFMPGPAASKSQIQLPVLSMSPNIAVIEGSQLILNCTSSIGQTDIIWMFTPVSSGSAVTAGSCLPDGSAEAGYIVEHPTPTACNLVIYDVDTSYAGLYACVAIVGVQVSSQLVVVGLDPMCNTSLNNTDAAVAGQPLVMTAGNGCYGCNAVNATMVWTPYDGTPAQTVPAASNYTYAQGSFTANVTIPEVTGYNVTLQFLSVSSDIGLSSNDVPPQTFLLCSYNNFSVLYPPYPSNISIDCHCENACNWIPNNYSLQLTAYLNSTLFCNATTYPGASMSYQWIDSYGRTTYGQYITLSYLTTNAFYQCFVNNSIGIGSQNVTVTVQQIPSTTVSTTILQGNNTLVVFATTPVTVLPTTTTHSDWFICSARKLQLNYCTILLLALMHYILVSDHKILTALLQLAVH